MADFVQSRDKGRWIACPEDKTVDFVRSNGNHEVPAAVWIGDPARTRVETPHEPIAVEGRNIGAITGGNDRTGGFMVESYARSQMRGWMIHLRYGNRCDFWASESLRG